MFVAVYWLATAWLDETLNWRHIRIQMQVLGSPNLATIAKFDEIVKIGGCTQLMIGRTVWCRNLVIRWGPVPYFPSKHFCIYLYPFRYCSTVVSGNSSVSLYGTRYRYGTFRYTSYTRVLFRYTFQYSIPVPNTNSFSWNSGYCRLMYLFIGSRPSCHWIAAGEPWWIYRSMILFSKFLCNWK